MRFTRRQCAHAWWVGAVLALAVGCASSKQATDAAPKPAADAAAAGNPSPAATPAPVPTPDPAPDDPARPKFTRSGQRHGPGGVLVDHIECGTLGNHALWFDILQPEQPNRPPVPVILRLDMAWNNSGTPTSLLTRLVERGDYVCLRVPCWNLPDTANPAATPEVANALGWVVANAASCDMTPDRIGLWMSTREGESVCTLQRGTMAVLSEEKFEPGEVSTSRIAAFFDQHLHADSPPPPPRGNMTGRARARVGF